jgi:hypothetical protein
MKKKIKKRAAKRTAKLKPRPKAKLKPKKATARAKPKKATARAKPKKATAKPAPKAITIEAVVWQAGSSSEEIGELEVPSGVVHVCDAGTLFAPVAVKLPKGVYEVRVARDDRGDNGAAVLAKKGAKPVKWKNVGAYAVDAGMAGFFDGDVFMRVDKHVWPISIYDDLISNHLDPAEAEGHAGAFVPYEETKFSACRSGGGDGVYPVFAGHDANGDVVVVVTTF